MGERRSLSHRQGIHRVQGKADNPFLEGVTILVLCPVVGLVPNLSKAEERSSNPRSGGLAPSATRDSQATPNLPVGISSY